MAEKAKNKWWKCPDCKGQDRPGRIFDIGLREFRDCTTCKGKGQVFWSRGDSNGYGYGI